MCVLVEIAAESVTSVDAQPVESVGFGNWFRDGPQGCCTPQGGLGTMLFVERFELGECVEQVGPVLDQHTVP